jgi:biopolymer transport protein ExbD
VTVVTDAGRARSAAITSINVTPLVDITLVLLVVFMVTAKLIVRDRELPLDLPKAASGTEVQQVLGVSILGSGETRIDGERVDEEAILERAKAARDANPELRVAIEAEGVVPHARVMHVLDLLRQAGVSRIGFGVIPYPAPSVAAPGGARE